MGTADQVVIIHQIAMENQKKALIEKATQWLFENVYDYLNPEDQERVESFRKYLEEQYERTEETFSVLDRKK